uniref:Uncharacterized protein n=1 Tax=Haptolina ericina TaxID=156174 RepID=A0A7S3FFI4_9EUKA
MLLAFAASPCAFGYQPPASLRRPKPVAPNRPLPPTMRVVRPKSLGTQLWAARSAVVTPASRLANGARTKWMTSLASAWAAITARPLVAFMSLLAVALAAVLVRKIVPFIVGKMKPEPEPEPEPEPLKEGFDAFLDFGVALGSAALEGASIAASAAAAAVTTESAAAEEEAPAADVEEVSAVMELVTETGAGVVEDAVSVDDVVEPAVVDEPVAVPTPTRTAPKRAAPKKAAPKKKLSPSASFDAISRPKPPVGGKKAAASEPKASAKQEAPAKKSLSAQWDELFRSK